ncbi:MAG: SUMF1/EgtB/PvdO family nonheme iron enzyme [Kiritimatiellae bacterium]|nr:SUMF1/EgtB/PvdO family nonheme iron enzyme [Kiritimatiellia bacterium]
MIKQNFTHWFACWFTFYILAVSCFGQGLLINAIEFDKGNVRISQKGETYADGPACIWHGSGKPDEAGYFVEFPVDGDYTLEIQYAAQTSRPVDILLDGAKIHTGLKAVTGSWNTKSAGWEKQCVMRVTAGMRLITLRRSDAFPHICALRIEAVEPLPPGKAIVKPAPEKRDAVLKSVAHRQHLDAVRRKLLAHDPKVIRRAIDDLEKTFPGVYDAATHRHTVENFAGERKVFLDLIDQEGELDMAKLDKLLSDVNATLLANPLLDLDRLLVVRRRIRKGQARRATGRTLGWVPNNYLSHSDLPGTGYDNEIVVMSGLREQSPTLKTLYRPEHDTLVRDVRLDFSGQRLLFSGLDQAKRWAIFQINIDGSGLEQLSPTNYPDLDFFDACYLPNGKIILCSNAYYVGVPCLSGNNKVSSLYLLDPATKDLRQLTFDQDHGNDPVVLNDGRVLYQRWEYSDIPHYFSRRRMTMNQDGTGQLALHGSNAWFPTAFRFAQPVPNHPTLLIGVISGHHCRNAYGDAGRLALLDPALASAYPFRYRPDSKEWGELGKPIAVTPEILPAEKTGFLQLIPGYGKPVAGTVCDAAVTDVYLKQHPSLATHPYPLSEKYFLVSMKPDQDSLWGIYLVDIFDNATLIMEEEDTAFFEPLLFKARPRPPEMPDRVNLDLSTADVHIADIYSGPGLKGVPRGTVRAIRVFAYHFCYIGRGGFPLVGTESGWDIKRVLGTARVEEDGSACFQVPANTPISLQPLDADGNALQLMRSWLVGMPGERVSCAGCHEDRNASLPPQRSIAETRQSEILKPWYGGAVRPFAFTHEIYPVLERHCIGCHSDKPLVGPRSKPSFKDPKTAYDTLHPYVRRAGIEGDIALLNPMEYHTSTSLLFQMLEKGHHGITFASMGVEARERFACWIDLNAPFAGNWNAPEWKGCDPVQRRLELSKAFANVDVDPEAEHAAAAAAFLKREPVDFVKPLPMAPVAPDKLQASGFPMDADTARHRQAECSELLAGSLDLGNGSVMKLVTIPAGEFVMGSLNGAPDERPRAVVQIKKPFRMTVTEVTNGQYAQFDPDHDTRYIDMLFMDHVVPGHIANHPEQPVARVSHDEAMAFCAWLSEKSGLRVTLPDEAQWEWAARAGAETQFFYGTMESDFGRFANLADSDLRNYRMKWEGASVLQNRYPFPPEKNFPLHDPRFKDNWFVVDYVGQTEANAWGLKDMVGNVSEWTRSTYTPYPYPGKASDNQRRKVARGGSWANRPADAGATVRRAYQPWQKVFDVGFRVIVETD